MRYKNRVIFAIVSVVVLIGTIAWWSPGLLSFKPSIKPVPHNDLTEASNSVRLQTSASIFNVNLLVLAVLWGLIVAQKDETRLVLRDKPELISFACGNILLVTCFLLHYLYLRTVASVFADAANLIEEENATIPDLGDAKIQSIIDGQFWCLCAGGIIVVLTLLSAYWMKEDR